MKQPTFPGKTSHLSAIPKPPSWRDLRPTPNRWRGDARRLRASYASRDTSPANWRLRAVAFPSLVWMVKV